MNGSGGVTRWAVSLVLLLTAAAPVVQAQGSAAAAPGTRYFTNTQNARRVAASRTHLAVATSGGVLVWTRARDRWQKVGMGEGLPTHNVFDVAFDPAEPDTLWALCGTWIERGPARMPALHLAAVSLSSGQATPEAVRDEPPVTRPRGFWFWYDYRLGVGEGRLTVATSDGTNLVYDRAAKVWHTGPETGVVSPRPASPVVDTPAVPYWGELQRAVVLLDRYLLVTDTAVAVMPRRKTGGASGDGVVLPLPYGRAAEPNRYPVPVYSPPMRLREQGSDGALTFDVLETTDYYNDDRRATKRVLLTCRLSPKEKRIARVAKRAVAEPEARRLLAANPAPPTGGLLRGGICTDVLDDGQGSLWFATGNQPNIHATGVARFQVATGKWSYPTEKLPGLAANFATVGVAGGQTFAFTTNGSNIFDSARGDFVPVPPATLSTPELVPFRNQQSQSVRDPSPEGRGRNLYVLTRLNDSRLIAQVPYYDRGPDGNAVLLVNTDARTATPLTEQLPELKELLVACAATADDGVVLFFGEQVSDANPKQAFPLVALKWDPKTGKTRRYSGAWPGADARRGNGGFQNRQPPRARMFAAAGRYWLSLDSKLHRLDPATDAWTPEGDFPYGSQWFNDEAGALWVLQNNTFGGFMATIRRWTAASGWQRVDADEEFGRRASSGFAFDGERFWFSGIGVMAVPPAALRLVGEPK